MSSAISRTMASEDETKMIAVSNWSRRSCIRRMIWAATVTSSCWVTLSAMREGGVADQGVDDQRALHHAAGILERELVEAALGRGMRTALSTSSARSRAACLDMSGWTARSFSTI